MSALQADDLEAAFRAHASELRNFLSRRLRCRETAADIAQETYLKLISSPPIVEPVRNRRALLFQVARNLAVDHLRGRRRSATLEQGLKAMYEVSGETPPGTEETLIASDQIDSLRAALATLPSPTKEIFELSRLQGLPRDTVAHQLGVSGSTVAKHLAFAVLFLREQLERQR
jgi:RNA polymerase sigma factor (sigma-70 family)